MAQFELKHSEIFYPESDGKPMAETDIHRILMVDLIDVAGRHFKDDPLFYVSGNLFVYYAPGDPRQVVAPDFFVVRGIPKGLRRIYKVWEEGRAPQLVIELTSASTHLEDLGNKRAIYEEMGVQEYFIFDPEGVRFQPTMRGYMLKNGIFQPQAPLRMEQDKLIFRSEVLQLELHGQGSWLRLVDPETRKSLPTSQELEQIAEIAKNRAETNRIRAEAESERADQEKQRAEAAEVELARLREEIARLRGKIDH